MKTVTITIPDTLDRQAAMEARRRGISKSELFRQGIRALIPDAEGERDPAVPPDDADPWRALAGFGSDRISVDVPDIDAVVYGE